MNIFILDSNPTSAAKQMCDKHVVKMIIESGQMLSTAHRVLDGDEYYDLSRNGRRIKRWRLADDRENFLYKASFMNHPCTRWTMETKSNYHWHTRHALSLCIEYTARYGKIHKAQPLIEFLDDTLPENIPDRDVQTPFPQAMPEEYKNKCAVTAYRAYYLGEKKRFAKWKNTETPSWFLTGDPEYCMI